jgi:uncharacterized membrane protein
MSAMTLPIWLGPFKARPRLVVAFLGGLAVCVLCRLLASLQWSTCTIIGWDALCVGFIASVLVTLTDDSQDEMRARSAREDQGRGTILAVVLTAAVATIIAVALELSLAKDAHGLERILRITLAFVTVAASWFMVHTIFALHYAHEYYDCDEAMAADEGGLHFPGDQEPDYWDFLHFSIIIGVASQTADIEITSKQMRHLNTLHALFSFAFNTVVVALTINLLAGLFS